MMIIGYQVRDGDGNIWAKRQMNEVLSEEVAIADLEAANSASKTSYHMIAVLETHVQNPVFIVSLRLGDTQKTGQYHVDHCSKTNCDSRDIVGGYIEIQNREASQSMHCMECGYEWRNIYKFDRIESDNE